MATNLEEIKKILESHKAELREKYKIKEIGVFGSYVRGEQKKRSDIDILVEFDELPDLLRFIEIERYLEKLIHKKLIHKKVDLIEKTGIRPELKDIILKETVYV